MRRPDRYALRRVARLAALAGLLVVGASADAQSSDSKMKIATIINLKGYLCAEVVRVTPLKLADTYEIECVQYRGGNTKTSYVVNAATGAVAPN